MKAPHKKSQLWLHQEKASLGGECQKCKEICDKLTVDHLFPVSLLHKFGFKEEAYEDADNMELICRKCNTLKQDSFDFHNPKLIPLIEKYLNKLKEVYGKKETHS